MCHAPIAYIIPYHSLLPPVLSPDCVLKTNTDAAPHVRLLLYVHVRHSSRCIHPGAQLAMTEGEGHDAPPAPLLTPVGPRCSLQGMAE